MDGRRWQAEPAPRLSPDSIPTLSSSNYGQEWLQHQSERMLQKVENTIKRLTVDVEDLQELVRLNRNCILSSKDHSRKTTMTTDTSFLFRGDLQSFSMVVVQWSFLVGCMTKPFLKSARQKVFVYSQLMNKDLRKILREIAFVIPSLPGQPTEPHLAMAHYNFTRFS